jgi:hypothetical protein
MSDDRGPAVKAGFKPLRPWERPDFVGRPLFALQLGMGGSVRADETHTSGALGWAVFDAARRGESGEIPLHPDTGFDQKVAEAVTAIELLVQQKIAAGEGEPETLELFVYDERTFPSSVPASEGMTLAEHDRQVRAIVAKLRERGHNAVLRAVK